jgi:anaerobic magnesium-protoporphyrin IX monomethyl ester cyclase
MKIQLINAPPFDLSKSSERMASYPPLGLLYIASYVRQFKPDIEWKISDGTLYGFKKCIDDFRQFKPDIVGISFTTPFATGAYKLIDTLKEIRPDVRIVAGGAHPSILPEEALKKVDTVVIGEGEKSFLRVIEGERGKICSDYIEDLDKIPFPARDLVNMKEYPGNSLKSAQPETSIISTRGCAWNKCWFCSNPWKINKPWYRARSPKNVVDEIQMLMEKYNIKEYYDQSEELNVGVERGIGICKEIMDRGLDIKWKTQIRADTVSEELIKNMAKAGCWMIYMGIESGNQSTLDGIQKGITLENVERVCTLAHKYGIKTFGFFVFFHAWEKDGMLQNETLKESMNTLSYGKRLMKQKILDYSSWMIATPFPFSPLWDTCMKYDLIPKEYLGKWENWNLGYNLLMKLPNVSAEDLEVMRKEIRKMNLNHLIKNVGLLRTTKLGLKFAKKVLTG